MTDEPNPITDQTIAQMRREMMYGFFWFSFLTGGAAAVILLAAENWTHTLAGIVVTGLAALLLAFALDLERALRR